jgi:hypothetical protein
MARLMTFRTLPEPVFELPSPNDLCKETYRVNQSREHFNKAISLIRKLACGDVSITDWDTEEKNIFSGAIIFYGINKEKVRKAVLKSLTPCQVITLLQQVHGIDWLSFKGTKKDWFSDLISIKAMACLLDSEGLRVIRDDVFGGTDGYGMQKYMMLESFNFIDIIRINAMVSTDAMRMICFPNGIPVNRLLSVVRKLSDADCGPETFKLVADTMQSNIARGDVTADATEDLLWKNISNIPEYYRLSFIKAIYPDPFVPKTECWTKLIFGHGQLCNTWNEENGDADPSMGEDIPDIPFCTDCAFQESGGDNNDLASCHCKERFHLDICSWLMQKSVPIPAGFWEQVAYYNLYHFAYFLHVDRPKSFFLDIQQSALMKCILFDRLAFAKFLVQFSYFPKALLSGIRTVWATVNNRSLPISNEMAAILQLTNKKRRREDVENMQSLVDEWKERLPGGFHLEICNRLQSMYK